MIINLHKYWWWQPLQLIHTASTFRKDQDSRKGQAKRKELRRNLRRSSFSFYPNPSNYHLKIHCNNELFN